MNGVLLCETPIHTPDTTRHFLVDRITTRVAGGDQRSIPMVLLDVIRACEGGTSVIIDNASALIINCRPVDIHNHTVYASFAEAMMIKRLSKEARDGRITEFGTEIQDEVDLCVCDMMTKYTRHMDLHPHEKSDLEHLLALAFYEGKIRTFLSHTGVSIHVDVQSIPHRDVMMSSAITIGKNAKTHQHPNTCTRLSQCMLMLCETVTMLDTSLHCRVSPVNDVKHDIPTDDLLLPEDDIRVRVVVQRTGISGRKLKSHMGNAKNHGRFLAKLYGCHKHILRDISFLDDLHMLHVPNKVLVCLCA